jgi:predicted MFS family arabinose efflux permease
VALRHVPESRDPSQARLDPAGAALAAAGLAGVTYALIEGPGSGWTDPVVLTSLVGGVVALAAFVVVERISRHPMLPLEIFRSRQFTAANLVTFVVYAALGGAIFLLAIQLQQVVGFDALQTGLAFAPMTVVMLLLSARAGRLAQRIGPRLPMTGGPLIAAVGLALMTRIDAGATYANAVLPAVLVFALGLALTVAPLTATVLAAASDEHAGVASGVNNDVARIGGLVAVAVLPPLAGISGADYRDPAAFSAGFAIALWICAGLCALGGLLSFLTIRRPGEPEADPEPLVSCPLEGPPPLRWAGPSGRGG